MNDRAVGLLEQYDIEVLRTRKGRGAILCDTREGCLILKEYTGNEDRLVMQDKVLKNIKEHIALEESDGVKGSRSMQAELIIPTKEGLLAVKDGDGVKYILKTYCEGRECNIHDRTECVEIMKLLAYLHKCMRLPADTEGLPPIFSPEKEYEKRNRELKKVRRYLQQRSQKTWFEIKLLQCFDYFLEQAFLVTKEWSRYQERLGLQENNTFCHGDYQYHNIFRCEEQWFISNFEKCIPDSPVRDIYLILRKLLEKSNWSIHLGKDLLTAYEQERELSAINRIDLYYRLAYPEKFWKIVNFYYNSRKAWIPERNQEKLEKLMEQEKEKQRFLSEVFCKLG